MENKCTNFERCGNYTNSPHTKFCQKCSVKWQVEHNGNYKKLGDLEIEEGGSVFIRKDLIDLFEKCKSSSVFKEDIKC